MRVALYWTPALHDPLAAAGHAWLGRDPERGVAVPQPAIEGIAEATEAARVYGFHATLRPPMRLATGWEEFLQSAHDLANRLCPFRLPPLAVTDVSGFLALCETWPSPELKDFADECVRATDRHRLAPSEAELARRRRLNLSATEEAMLARWGYPYVMERFRFHMTLTRRLDEAENRHFRLAADAHFAAALREPRQVEELVVFTQREDGFGKPPAPFLIADRLPLRGGRAAPLSV